MLFKADARKFLGDAFGSTADVFKARLSSKELFAELEIAVWEQILPLAKRSSTALANPAQVADREGQHIWNCLLHSCQGVAQRRAGFCRADDEETTLYRKCKDKVIEKFSSVCVVPLRDIFVQPLLESSGLLKKMSCQGGFYEQNKGIN